MLIEQANLTSRLSASNRKPNRESAEMKREYHCPIERSLELRAAVLLHSNPHLQKYSGNVQCCFRDHCLTLGGNVPSYYLKQLAQESVRGLEGVERIENQIAVVAPKPAVEPAENQQRYKPRAPHFRNGHSRWQSTARFR